MQRGWPARDTRRRHRLIKVVEVIGSIGTLGVAILRVGVVVGLTVVEWAAQPVMATAVAKMTAVMIRTGRIATSPSCSRP